MIYIVYITTNLKNGKIYVGVHKTKTPHMFDGYLGNGVYVPKTKPDFKIKNPKTPFKKAVNKYGAKNFIRVVISIFQEESEAYKLEEIIVTESFIKSKHTYNIKLGGYYATSTTAVKVNQYDTDGKYIKTWNSLTNAAEFSNISKSCILESCTEKAITAAGYVWRYHTDEKDDIKDITVRKRISSNNGLVNAKKVVQYSKQGHKKKTFISIAAAATHLKIGYMGISQCCNCLSTNRSAGGYQWRLESDKLDSLLPLNTKTGVKEVEQMYNDVVVATYKGSNQAAKELGFSKAGRSIRKACNSNKEYKGYFWRYKG